MFGDVFRDLSEMLYRLYLDLSHIYKRWPGVEPLRSSLSVDNRYWVGSSVMPILTITSFHIFFLPFVKKGLTVSKNGGWLKA